MAEQSLKDKAVKGVGWTATESILRYGISFVVGIVLARLLSPDEYGLIGLLTIFIALSDVIIDGGLINALIRKQDVKDIDYCTVFYTNLVMSIVMATIVFFSAGLIANFFERPELVPLTRVMSLILVIHALSLVQRARLTKAINFKTQTKVSVIASLFSGIVGITMAFCGLGVWALVGQQLGNALASAVGLWIANRWIPKLQFSKSSFKEMWNFGWKLLVSGLLNKLSGQLHHLVIGKCFSPATLGQYSRGYQFGALFSDNLTAVVQKVSFPVLSAIQNDPVCLKLSYRRVIKTTVLPSFILMMFLAAIAEPLLTVLIGSKWIDAAHYLQIISFSMMLYPLHSLNLNAIQVMGRSDLTLKINIIKNALMVIPVLIGIFTNIYWMLVADVVRGYACYYLNAYYSKYVINYSIKEQLRDISPSFFSAIGVALPVYFLSYLPFNSFIVLFIQVVVWSGSLFFLMEKLALPEYTEIKSMVKGYLLSKRK